jgi:hypothetical protein
MTFSGQDTQQSAGNAVVAMPDEATVLRLVTTADYPALARFAATFEDETRDEQFWLKRFDLWWDKNPAFRESVPRGWIIWEDGAIKGFLGNVPSDFLLNGKPVTALSTTTWRVLPSHRNHSLKLFFQAIRCAKGSIFFDTTPNDDAVAVVKGLKFQLFPYNVNPVKSFLFVNTKRVLQSRGMGAFAAWLGAPALRVLQNFRLRLGPIVANTSVRVLNLADVSFDELWQRTQSRYSNTSVRTAGAINWQCFGSETTRKSLIGCFCGEKLVGYLIVARGVRNGLRIASCVDVWLDPEFPAALANLLSFSRRWAKEQEIDAIEVPHLNQSLGQQLNALGLFQRTINDEQPSYYKAPDVGALDAATTFLTGIQGDKGL